jgi:peptide/nickel transport system substrate-binding protein
MRSTTRAAAAGLVGLATAAALVACSPPSDDPGETTFSVGVDAFDFVGVGAWNPALDSARPRFLGSIVYDVLAVWRPGIQDFEPRLAEDMTFSEDRMTLTIDLRDDVDYVDGEHLTAATVETYLDNLLTAPGYVFAGDVLPYEPEFTAVDEYTLELTTSKPIYVPDFFALFGETPILSPAAVADPEAAKTEPMGTGPYVIEEVITDSEATFVRNDDYWDPEAFPFDRVVVKLIEDPVARLNALKSGQIDAAQVSTEFVAEAEAAGLSLAETSAYFSTLWVRDPVNSTLEPLRDARVRQAMSYALDREGINETLDLGYGRVTSQIFNPGQFGYVEGGDDRYPYDLEKARDLMAEAGYADGFDVTIPTYVDMDKVSPIVQQSLADIGIRVTYEATADRLEWFTAMTSGQYPLVLEGIQGPVWSLRILVDDFAGFGRPFAQNDRVDELMAVIKGGSAEESQAAADEMGEMLLEDAWYIPINRPSKLWATVSDIVLTSDPTEVTLPDYPVLRDFAPAE